MNDANQSNEVNEKKLFVGNLPFSTSQGELLELFSEYGDVEEVTLITDKFSGRSKGFAFVLYKTVEAAQAAIDALAGKPFGGRDMVVNVAQPRKPREFRNNRGGHRGGNRSYGNDRRDNNRY